MGTELTLAFEGKQVRVFGDADNPQWVAADLEPLLGIQNIRQVVARFRDTERGVCTVYTPQGGAQEMTIVTEAGLYRLIFKSRKPEAERFRVWVTHEVLPCIRKHGCYPAPDVKVRDGAIIRIDEEAMSRVISHHLGIVYEQTLHGFSEVNRKIDSVDQKVDDLAGEFKRFSKRKELTKETKNFHIQVVYRMFRGMCPCCGKCRIVNPHGERLASAQFDHWRLPSQNAKEWTWVVCSVCNGNLRNGEFHRKHQRDFECYQDMARRLEMIVAPTLPGIE